MSWITRWLPFTARPEDEARAHVAKRRYRDALEALERSQSPDPAERERIVQQWLATAVAAAKEGRDNDARRILDEVSEVADEETTACLAAVRWQIREAQVCRGLVEPWDRLLKAAGVQSRRFHGKRVTRPSPRHALFADKGVIAALHRESKGAPDSLGDCDLVERLDDDALLALEPTLCFGIPESLWTLRSKQRLHYLRGALYLAASRPDLAAFAVLEAPGEAAILYFERARIAHALGYPKLATLALERFAELAGGHHTVRGIHSGVFLAQLLQSAKKHSAALDLLRGTPLELSGSTELLYIELLKQCGELDEAEARLDVRGDEPSTARLRDEIRALRAQAR